MAKTGDSAEKRLSKEDRLDLERMANEGPFTGPEDDGEDNRPDRKEKNNDPVH